MTNMQRLIEQLEHCTPEEFYDTINNIANGCKYCCKKICCKTYYDCSGLSLEGRKACKDQFVLWGAQQADEQ